MKTQKTCVPLKIGCCPVLIIVILTSLLLYSCSNKDNEEKQFTPSPFFIPTYVLTPGERLEELWGNHHHNLGTLGIWLGDTISQERYVNENGVKKERDTITLWVLDPQLGAYETPWVVHEGQVLILGEYRLRILEIRKRDSGEVPIVEVAILGP